MTTTSKTAANRTATKRSVRTDRSAAKRSAKAAKPTPASAGRKAKNRPKPTAAKAATRGAHDTTRKTVSKPRSARKTTSEQTSSPLKLQASRTRDALLLIPHTRATIVRAVPLAGRRFFQRADAFADKGRALFARVKDAVAQLTRQLHLPSLPGKPAA